MGDWNAVLDPNLDRGAISSGTNTLDARYFREFVQRLDLADKFRERHPNKLVWTWTVLIIDESRFFYVFNANIRDSFFLAKL